MLCPSLGFCCNSFEFELEHSLFFANIVEYCEKETVNKSSCVNGQKKHKVWSVIRAESINVLRKLDTTFHGGGPKILTHVSHWEHCAENICQPSVRIFHEGHENSL